MNPVMIVAAAVELYIPASHSLKEKRSVVKRLKDRLRRRFNVSVSETGDTDLHQRCDLVLSMAGDNRGYLLRQMELISTYIEGEMLGRAEVLRMEVKLCHSSSCDTAQNL